MLKFDSAEEELFYLLDSKPGFDATLLRLLDTGRFKFKYYKIEDCGCIYWAYFGCPVKKGDVLSQLNALFDLDEGQLFEGRNLDEINEISPLQIQLGFGSSPYSWLRQHIALWQAARGLATQESKSHRASLSPDRVREIREALASGETGVSISQRFSVSEQTVSAIKNGKVWADVE